MPFLTQSRLRHIEAEVDLPPKDRLMSHNGKTSLIWNTDDPNRVEVWTVESAKAFYWQEIGLSTTPMCVAEADLSGYRRQYWRYIDAAIFTRESFDVWRVWAERIQPITGSARTSKLAAQRARAIKYLDAVRRSHWRMSRGYENEAIWQEIASNAPFVTMRRAADFAIDYDCNLSVQFPRDAFVSWHGRLLWLDPYHDMRLLEAIRAKSRP